MSSLTAGGLVLVAVVTTLVGCAVPTSIPSERAVAQLTITSPAQGSEFSTASVVVTGDAPAGSRVVRDVSLAPDDEVIAGADGQWSMPVELEEGPNELIFRIGDEEATEQRLGVSYIPTAAASATQSPPPTPQPTTTPIPPPTASPTPSPPPPPVFRTFGDGTSQVGVDIHPGTYRLRKPAGFCYWERLSGFGGTLGDIIANDNVIDAYAVVTIAKTDEGFSSTGCGEWTNDLSHVQVDRQAIDFDGTYIVNTDILAGTWRSEGGDFCYWERLSGFGGTLGDIIANDNVLGGSAIVKVSSTDKGFSVQGCGSWTRS